MNFTVLIHEDEDGGYWAEVKELPGCITQGDSLEELEENAKDAIDAFLDGLAQDYVESLADTPASPSPDTVLVLGLKLERLELATKQK